MFTEQNGAQIKQTTSEEEMLDIAWPDQENLLNYTSCPDEFKQLIENTDLDKLVYWKLKENLEKQNKYNENDVLKEVLADVERPLFAIILNKTHGNQSKAAEVLGCNRNTLHKKLKDFFINPKDIKCAGKKGPLKKDSMFKGTSLSSLPFKHTSFSERAEV
jgi:Fis family transcriptional regulator